MKREKEKGKKIFDTRTVSGARMKGMKELTRVDKCDSFPPIFNKSRASKASNWLAQTFHLCLVAPL